MKFPKLFSLSSILLPKSFVVTLQGRTYTILRSEEGFEPLRKAVKEKDPVRIESLLKRYGYLKEVIQSVSKEIKKKFKNAAEHLDLEVADDGSLRINGVTYNNALTKKIVDLVNCGHSVESYYELLKKISNNSKEVIRSGLLDFILANDLPITTDGCFLAYKVTDGNGYDMHSHSILYSVGKEISEPRNSVSQDRGICSGPGLYFASKKYYDYVSSYKEGQNKRFLMKVDPVDVISIPTSYENSKGRCCKFTVAQEIGWDDNNIPSHEGIVDANELKAVKTIKRNATKINNPKAVVVKSGTQNLSRKRDAHGRFIKKKVAKRNSQGRFVRS